MIVNLRRTVVFVGLLTIGMGAAAPAAGAAEPPRTVTKKVAAAYPDIARKVHLEGTVKLSVVVTPDGNVRRVDVIGGHPVLVVAASDAARQWHFAPASKESSETLVFDFHSPE